MGGNIACAISGLPISCFDEARFLFLTQWNPVRGRLSTNGWYSPLHPPFVAKYDDYGFFENEDKESIAYRAARDTVLEYTGIDLDGDRGENGNTFCREGWTVLDVGYNQSLRIAGNEIGLAAIHPKVWDAALRRAEGFVNYEKQTWAEQVEEIVKQFETRYDLFKHAQENYSDDIGAFCDALRKDTIRFEDECNLPDWSDGIVYSLAWKKMKFPMPGHLPEREPFFKLLREVIDFYAVDSVLDQVGLRWMPSRRFCSDDADIRDWSRAIAEIADEEIRLFEEEYG